MSYITIPKTWYYLIGFFHMDSKKVSQEMLATLSRISPLLTADQATIISHLELAFLFPFLQGKLISTWQ